MMIHEISNYLFFAFEGIKQRILANFALKPTCIYEIKADICIKLQKY